MACFRIRSHGSESGCALKATQMTSRNVGCLLYEDVTIRCFGYVSFVKVAIYVYVFEPPFCFSRFRTHL